MGWCRQAYYQQLKAKANLHERDAKVVELVREVRRRHPRVGVGKLHHMLRGSLALHARHDITCLMTDGYDCYQNVLAERINGILKTEFLLQCPQDLGKARHMVMQLVAIYNHELPHQTLKYKTPDEIHRAS